jgi:predicted acylesterase/phospholipase RssA
MNPDLLVISPGGSLAFLQIGALAGLRDCLSKLTTIVGISTGAIIGFLLNLRYTPTEILIDLNSNAEFLHDFTNIDLRFVFTEAKSNSTIKLRNFLRQKLRHKVGLTKSGQDLNLKQLFDSTGIELVLVTLNVNRETTEFISYVTDPNMDPIDAVLYSINIPSLTDSMNSTGPRYIDGTFAHPYPVEHYDDGNRRIVGLYINGYDPRSSNLPQIILVPIFCAIDRIIKIICKNTSINCTNIELKLKSKTADPAELYVEGYITYQRYLNA